MKNEVNRFTVKFSCSNGSMDVLKRSYVPNVLFKEYAPLAPDGQPFFEVSITHGPGITHTHLDSRGKSGTRPELCPQLQDLIRGQWQYDPRSLLDIHDHRGVRLVPGYRELSGYALDEWFDDSCETTLRISPRIVEAMRSESGAPEYFHDEEHNTFFQLVRNDEEEIVAGFFGWFQSEFRIHRAGPARTMRTKGIQIYRLDKRLIDAILLEAEGFFLEGAVKPEEDFRRTICWNLRDFDELLKDAGASQDALTKMSFGLYAARAEQLYTHPDREVKKQQYLYFRAQKESPDFVMRVEQAVLSLPEGLADQFAVDEVFHRLLAEELNKQLPTDKASALLATMRTRVRQVLTAFTRDVFQTSPSVQVLKNHVGFPTRIPDQIDEEPAKT